MDKQQKMSALAQIIGSNPQKADFAASLLGALAKGNPTPKQAEWIDRLINEEANPVPSLTLAPLVEAFRAAAQAVKFPKVVVEADGVEWTLSYTRPDSDKAKPENRDTVGIASGKWGDPAAKWAGRILADGTVKWGKDATPALADAIAAIPTAPLPLKARK